MKNPPPSRPPPPSWPPHLPYLHAPSHSPHLTPQDLTSIRRPLQRSTTTTTTKGPSPRSIGTSPRPAPSLSPSPTRIQKITNPAHPAHPQHGLFATRPLAPDTFILPYFGVVHNALDTDPTSDYDLCLSRDAGLGVDAAVKGNEARFVNDYRGVPVLVPVKSNGAVLGDKGRRRRGDGNGNGNGGGGRGCSGGAAGEEATMTGPNAEFRECWIPCASVDGVESEEMTIGVFVRGRGRSGKWAGGIAKGEEILESYGKGFWSGRVGVADVGDDG